MGAGKQLQGSATGCKLGEGRVVLKEAERVGSSWINGTEVLVSLKELWSGTPDAVIWKSPGGGAGVGCLKLRLCREWVWVLVET